MIQLRDLATGNTVTLGTVKQSVLGQLVPPNQIVWADALDGIRADVVIVWKHNQLSQNVLLRERPLLPAGFNPDSTRIEVLTEFLTPPTPLLTEQAYSTPGAPDITEHVVISFGEMVMLRGKAFQVAGDNALSLGAWDPAASGVPVVKQWQPLNDGSGSAFLVESAGWSEIQPELQNLPVTQASAAMPKTNTRLAEARVWPKWLGTQTPRAPIQLASLPYRPNGLLIDFNIGGSVSSFTFTNGVTFFITNTFYVNPNTATFQPGCIVKYTNTSCWLIVGGPVSFPNTLQTPVFTSKDDDSFGDTIPGSTGSPGYQASEALWIYYPTFSTTVQNARFRWAQRGVEYDGTATHTIQNCLFENCQVGIQNNLVASNLTLTAINKCSVTAPVAGNTPNGSMTAAPFCTGTSFKGVDGSETNVNGQVPDTMGAIGLTNFLEVINSKLVNFRRTDGKRSTNEISLSDFFKAPGQNARTMVDPRVLFDSVNQRWVASAIDSTDRGNLLQTVVLKVSQSSNADLSSTNWFRYAWTNALSSTAQSFDYQTLGSDVNGLYVSVDLRPGGDTDPGGYVIQALKKPDVYSTNYTLPARLGSTNSDLLTWCIQPAYNFDGSPPGGYAWFVAKGPSSGNQGGQIYYRRLQWSGRTPSWADATWQPVSDSTPTYRDYFDIPQGATNAAPQTGGTVDLGDTGSRLMMAVIRNNYLFTCHHVGLDGGGNSTYDGGTVDRSAIQWFKLQVSSGGLSYSSHNRIYDSAYSSPYWFFFPSLNVDATGNLAFGFSASKSGENVGGFYHGRKADGTWLARPVLVQAGRSAYTGGGVGRFGDYSATSIDPNDGSFWTIQECSMPNPDPVGDPIWGTWIMQIKVP